MSSIYKRKIDLVLISIFCLAVAEGQDVFTRGLVYQVPEMKEVIIKEKIVYRTVNDTALSFDIYYPPSFAFKTQLPVVIFNNGIGSMDIPRWGVYKDWAKLIAATGMIAINHQGRPGNALEDGEALLDYITTQATALSIDTGKLGLWTCSANARTGMRIAYKTRPKWIKALVVYYGGPDSLGQLRQNLPTLIVRAGLDAQFINTGVDNFVHAALQQDARVELVNYVDGIHAFDVFTNTGESKEMIRSTVSFFQKHLSRPVLQNDFVLTNKNFMWLIANNQLQVAVTEFRKARNTYRADTAFQPFYNAVIREDILNANGYSLLRSGRQNEALEVFRLATESYPESPNAYESLSEALEATGNRSESTQAAKMSLQKLPAAANISESFRRSIRQSAEQRIKRLSGESAPHRRAHHDLVYDEENKKILLTTGSTPLDSGRSFKFFNDTWTFDGVAWEFKGFAGDERSGTRMAYDTKRHRLFSFGGYADSSRAELRLFDNGRWKILSSSPDMRAAEPGFVYDAGRDKLIAFGGSAERGRVNDITWEWDGYSWKKFKGPGPAGRQAFVMIYDSKRAKTVLYGGMDGSGKALNDGVWEFDGMKWVNIRHKGTGPGSRVSSGYVYDSKRQLLILFGGYSDGNVVMNDTWGWNGQQWKRLAETGPSKRSMGYMAYDKARDRIVLFGGRTGWPNDADDTWEWDGKKWKEIKTLGRTFNNSSR